MQRSFKDRLAALEALEAAAEAEQLAAVPLFDEADADALDDKALLIEAYCGLTQDVTRGNALCFVHGALAVAPYWSQQNSPARHYWARIAERAGPLLKERAIVLFPLMREDAQTALEWIDSGVLRCRPLRVGEDRSHHNTIFLPHDRPLNDLWALHARLTYALDQVVAQTGDALIETSDELRATLVAAFGDRDYEPVQETA